MIEKLQTGYSVLLVACLLFAAPVRADEPAGGNETKAAAAEPASSGESSTSAPATSTAPGTTEPADTTATKNAEETPSSNSESSAPKTTLKGGVRGAALLTVDGLVGIETDAKVLQTNVFEIMKECTRKETAVMRGPNYIGNGIVIPAIGGPSGMVQVGDLPARRDKLEAFLASSEEVFNVLQNHMDALIIPENPPEQMANLWTGMRSTLEATKGNIEKMKELLAQHKFDKKQVGRAALKVYDSMTALEKMRSQILGLVQPGKE